MQTMAVIGAGAWGTALALTLRRAGRNVVLWAHDPAVADAIRADGENRTYLPGVSLDPEIRVTADLADTASAEALLLVTPAQHLRSVAGDLAGLVPARVPWVLCCKGIEQTTGLLMSEVVAEIMPGAPAAVLSGPNFAAEVARGLPAAATLACRDEDLGRALMAMIGAPRFRPYFNRDVVGAEIGGAVKNVLAIACGIVTGRKFGENARAALITRGIAEMVRLADAKGGRATTLIGLSGLGDVTLTCNSTASRNMSLGHALGEGRSLADILAARRSVAEGVATAQAVTALAETLGVAMPIAAAVDAILHKGADIDATIDDLLARPLAEELPGV